MLRWSLIANILRGQQLPNKWESLAVTLKLQHKSKDYSTYPPGIQLCRFWSLGSQSSKAPKHVLKHSIIDLARNTCQLKGKCMPKYIRHSAHNCDSQATLKQCMTTAEGQNTEEPRQIIFQQNRKKKFLKNERSWVFLNHCRHKWKKNC